MKTMEHSEAVDQMATERYLLNELTPDQRDAFEQHFFDCPECALDLRVASTFVDEAKIQLPGLTAAPARPAAEPQNGKKRDWFAWLRPAFNPVFAGPVFTALLLVMGYQNTVQMPGLRAAADEPRVVPLTSLRGATRSGERKTVEASHKLGAGLVIDLPQEPVYPSYAFAMYDAQGKTVWTLESTAASLGQSGTGADAGPVSLSIPGNGLQAGTYTLTVQGIAANGQRTELQRSLLDIHFNDGETSGK
jgi:Putative zinc-finger